MPSSSNCPECGSKFDSKIQAGCPTCQIKLGLGTQEEQVVNPRVPLIPIEELKERFVDLEILDLIGVGGMGAVYRARQKKLDRIVAIKVVRPDISESDEFSQRFEREAKAMARLNHPNIVSIYDFGNSEGIFYYIMELVDGPNLAELAGSESLNPNESLEIVTQVCKAMQYAHDNGVVHRDIKPTNILLNSEGAVKIADFGLAKLCSGAEATTQLTQTQQVFGTPRYMAPEQIEASKEVDHRADIYSLGVVFYELLTGELPLGRFDPPSEKIHVDVRLDEVVLRALEKHPERRYQAAREFQTDISQIVQPVPPVKMPVAQTVARDVGIEAQSYQRPDWRVPSTLIPGALAILLGILGVTIAVANGFYPSRLQLRPGHPLFSISPLALISGVVLVFMGLFLAIRSMPKNKAAELWNGSPVRILFNSRALIYLLFAILVCGAAMPWFGYEIHKLNSTDEVGFIFAYQTWQGISAILILAVGIPLLVFVDIYEGNGVYFFGCQLVIAAVCHGISIASVQPPVHYYIPQTIRAQLVGARFTSETFGPGLMIVPSSILLVIAVLGLLICGINKLMSPPVKESLGSLISKTSSGLVQWRDQFSDFVNGKRNGQK